MSHNNNTPIIIGIDPGYDRVGYAIGTKNKAKNTFTCLTLGCIQTDSAQTIFQRYQAIQNQLEELLIQYQPTQLAIETLFFSKNKTTALRVSEARGVIIATCLQHDIEVFEYSPGAVKLAVTGSGSADKRAVEKMVRMQVDSDIGTHLDDTLDAVAIALTHCFTKS